jgi:hypothetical protein
MDATKISYVELAGYDPPKKTDPSTLNAQALTPGGTGTTEATAPTTNGAANGGAAPAEHKEEEEGTEQEAGPDSEPAVGAVGAAVLAATQSPQEERAAEGHASGRGPWLLPEHDVLVALGHEDLLAMADGQPRRIELLRLRGVTQSSEVEFPVGLSAKQKRLYLRDQMKKALDAGDVRRCKLITELQEKLDDRHDRRLSRDGALRKADRENPYDRHLLEVYAEADIPWVVHKFCKAVRWDASALGLVGGVAFILEHAARSVGESVSPAVLRAQGMAWKIKERFHGLGKEWVTDGNQIMRLDAAARDSRVPEDKWLRRHPLPGPDAWEDEFEGDWQSWLAKSGTKSGE